MKIELTNLIDLRNSVLSEIRGLRKKVETLRRERTINDLIFQKLETQIVQEEGTLLRLLNYNRFKEFETEQINKKLNEKIKQELAESESSKCVRRSHNFIKETDSLKMENTNAKTSKFRSRFYVNSELDIGQPKIESKTVNLIGNLNQDGTKSNNERSFINKSRKANFIMNKSVKENATQFDDEFSADLFTHKKSMLKIDIIERILSELKMRSEFSDINELMKYSMTCEANMFQTNHEISELQNEVI